MFRSKRFEKGMTIRSFIERSFIMASFIILIAGLIGSFYFYQSSLEERRDSNLQKIHEILSHLIVPVLNISDVTEIRRLLQFASSKDEIFVVVDNNGNVLMPDYTNIGLIKSVSNTNATIDCDHLHTVYRSIGENGYWINCTILKDDNLPIHNKNLGMLLSFSKHKWNYFLPIMLYFIGIMLTILLFIIVWFRQTLYRQLLKPLVILGSHIVEKSKSPLTTGSFIGDIGRAPCEIIAIKSSFEKLLTNLQTEYQKRTGSEKKAILLDLAAQVAHDIRSPLAVMEMILISTAKYIPQEDASIQKEAIQSIRDIANNLLNRYREPNIDLAKTSLAVSNEDCSASRSIFLYSLVEQVISQKRQEWKNYLYEINFIAEPLAKFACVQTVPNGVKRILSNLLNNAFEALGGNERKITLKLLLNEQFLQLHIHDTGIGILADKINLVLTGTSFKHTGKGLGLSGAKKFMEDLGGNLGLISKVGSGTQVTLSFPIASQPAWFPAFIRLPKEAHIIILDDDNSIHCFWRQRLQLIKKQISYFYSIQDVIEWYHQNSHFNYQTIFLLDYELKNDIGNGLELLQKFHVREHGYLITSHAEEANIQEQVTAIGAWLIPKSLMADVAIKLI